MSNGEKIHFPYLLNALSRASFNGTLTLFEGDVKRCVVFQGGKPVNVISHLQEETLGRILLEEGKLSTVEYTKLLNQMAQGHKPAGEVLISLGLLGPQDVFIALEFQTRKKFLNCFKMVDFGFTLEPKTISSDMHITTLDPAEMLFTGIQEAYSVDRLLSEFPVDEDTLFTFNNVPSDRPVKMGTKENRLYRAIGNGTPMSKLMNTVEDLKTLLSYLYAMHALNLIEASGITRPSTKDLELADKFEQIKAVSQGNTAQPGPNTSPETHNKSIVETTSESRPTTLRELLAANGISDQLARKVLTLARANHFELLEIPFEATLETIKSAFYKILRVYKLQNIDSEYSSERDRDLARRLLNRITMAYRELSEEENRKTYLRNLNQGPSPEERKVDPRIQADVEAQKGDLALGAKRYDEARALFAESIRIYPNEPTYHFKLGLAGYFKALDHTPADQPLPEDIRKPFLKAMAMNPRYDQPRMYLGYIAKRNGKLKMALKEFEGAVECNPNNNRALSEIRLLKKRLLDVK